MGNRNGVKGGPADPVYVMGGSLTMGTDIEIGAVELKDSVSDNRVAVDAQGALLTTIDQTTPGTTNAVQTVNPRSTVTATIANGASLSGAVDVGNNVVVGIVMPAAWTTATLSFQGSHDGTTYQELKDENDVALSYNPLVACNRAVDPLHFLAWRYIKVRSGTAASAVAQGAERVVTLVTRPI